MIFLRTFKHARKDKNVSESFQNEIWLKLPNPSLLKRAKKLRTGVSVTVRRALVINNRDRLIQLSDKSILVNKWLISINKLRITMDKIKFWCFWQKLNKLFSPESFRFDPQVTCQIKLKFFTPNFSSTIIVCVLKVFRSCRSYCIGVYIFKRNPWNGTNFSEQ